MIKKEYKTKYRIKSILVNEEVKWVIQFQIVEDETWLVLEEGYINRRWRIFDTAEEAKEYILPIIERESKNQKFVPTIIELN